MDHLIQRRKCSARICRIPQSLSSLVNGTVVHSVGGRSVDMENMRGKMLKTFFARSIL